jgi:hypothetical protein
MPASRNVNHQVWDDEVARNEFQAQEGLTGVGLVQDFSSEY